MPQINLSGDVSGGGGGLPSLLRYLQGTSELDAVNSMLASISEHPVDNLESTLPEAQTALVKLRETSRFIQSDGWSFNKITISLSPDSATGFIVLPKNTLQIYTNSSDIVLRGRRLFNRASNTFIFTSEQSVDVIEALIWEDLPDVMRRYVTLNASLEYAQNWTGSSEIIRFLSTELNNARIQLNRHETKAENRNLLSNSEITKFHDGRRSS